MEDLNQRFGMERAEMKIADDNIYDYFHRIFGMEPLDYFLLELPIDSHCGLSCKDAIDWAIAFYHNPRHDMAMRMLLGHLDEAYSHYRKDIYHHSLAIHPMTIDDIATIAFDCIEIYWRG